MKELSLKEKMQLEAMERLGLLKAKALARAKILNDWKITKCVVDYENETVNDELELTEDESRLIRSFEEKYKCAVYYVIQDQGMWPDGCLFPRYTFLYVSQYEEDWQMDKEECIGLDNQLFVL